MHFLSHFYTELPADDPLYVAGLIIPDLTRGFSKAYNSVLKNSLYPEEKALKEVHSGILKHYEGDKKFHNSILFMQHCSSLTQSFIKEELSRKRLRLSVIAHLAIEMLIDRHIMLENETLCVEFYSTLERVDEKVLGTYFDRFALHHEKSSFFTNFIAFKQRQFLPMLMEMKNIVFGLNRIYGSVTKTEFTEDEKLRFLTALYNIDEEMRYSWKEILKG